jgi:hypothetical protein
MRSRRARDHCLWAEWYERLGAHDKAAAHFGRAMHYGRPLKVFVYSTDHWPGRDYCRKVELGPDAVARLLVAAYDLAYSDVVDCTYVPAIEGSDYVISECVGVFDEIRRITREIDRPMGVVVWATPGRKADLARVVPPAGYIVAQIKQGSALALDPESGFYQFDGHASVSTPSAAKVAMNIAREAASTAAFPVAPVMAMSGLPMSELPIHTALQILADASVNGTGPELVGDARRAGRTIYCTALVRAPPQPGRAVAVARRRNVR